MSSLDEPEVVSVVDSLGDEDGLLDLLVARARPIARDAVGDGAALPLATATSHLHHCLPLARGHIAHS